jgi:hypothetical protein
MQRLSTLLRPATAVVISLGASVVIAACGGSSPAGSAAAASTTNTGLKFASCVRAHGVPDYPDPRAGKITVDTHTLSESTQIVNTALSKCQKQAPGLDVNSLPRLSAAQMATVRAGSLALAKCMRARGLVDFPDPIVAVGPGGHGIEIGFSRRDLQKDHSVFTSPAYNADNAACGKAFVKTFPASLRK